MSMCLECAAPISEKQNFCTNCGAKVSIKQTHLEACEKKEYAKKHTTPKKTFYVLKNFASTNYENLTFWAVFAVFVFILALVRYAAWAGGFQLIYDDAELYYGVTRSDLYRSNFEDIAILWFAVINIAIILIMKILGIYRHFSPGPDCNYPVFLWSMKAVSVVFLPMAVWNLVIPHELQFFLYDIYSILFDPHGVEGAAVTWAVVETAFFQSTSLFSLWVLAKLINKNCSRIKSDGA